MTEKGRRIEKVMKHFGLNKNSFSKEMGLSSNVTIGRILNEERNPHPTTLKKIVARFPQVNYDWLQTGKGEMLKESIIDIGGSTSDPTVYKDRGAINPLQMEFDFNKWIDLEKSKAEIAKMNAESFQKIAAGTQDAIRTNAQLVEGCQKLIQENSNLIKEAISEMKGSIARIEKKIDDREGVVSKSGNML